MTATSAIKILSVVGTRPNFVKVAPVHQALTRHGHEALLVHTGQHYDATMSSVFFDELGMPKPYRNLGIGSGSHAIQTARVMEAFEPLLDEVNPEWVLVAGDVNSTLACALVAVKRHLRVAHLEAGLRSGDRTMPEEINRVLTDQISDLLLTPSPDADVNLSREGIPDERIVRVGNAMIDSLEVHIDAARRRRTAHTLGLTENGYVLVTLHRPSNVDHQPVLTGIIQALRRLAEELPVVWPVHPRALARLEQSDLIESLKRPGMVRLLEPQGYLDFLSLQATARVVLTDSGGIQEETTALEVPCLTLRSNTERPITIDQGTNRLVGTQSSLIVEAARDVLRAPPSVPRRPELWDGNTAERVVEALESANTRAPSTTP